MACFHPLEAWQLESGEISFRETRDCRRALWLPCGRCIGCRSVRARSWAIRCMHEASLYPFNSFVTLTYDEDHVPLSLDYSHFQEFIRSLRKRNGVGYFDVTTWSYVPRYYVCGEYGSLTNRPHFHACIFGFRPRDGKKIGDSLYSSALLDSCWKRGYTSFGDVTVQSAGYVARYCLKKVTGSIADHWYKRLDVDTGELVSVSSEMGRMSLKPGIGFGWFLKHWRDVYQARDGVVFPGGRTVPPPRYYDKLLVDTCPALACEKEVERYINSQRFVEDCTPQRLLVREHCAKAREAFRRRSL